MYYVPTSGGPLSEVSLYWHAPHLHTLQGLLKELEDFAFQGCSKPMAYDTAAAGEDVREGVEVSM